jgi:hypothetical protein
MPISLGPGAEAEPLRVAIIGAVASFRGFCVANMNYSASDSDAPIYGDRRGKATDFSREIRGEPLSRGHPGNLGGFVFFLGRGVY